MRRSLFAGWACVLVATAGCGCGGRTLPADAPLLQPPAELTPVAAKQALLDMMRTDGGPVAVVFDPADVTRLATTEVTVGEDEYEWSAACRIDRRAATYTLYFDIQDKHPLFVYSLPPRVHHMARVYQGSFTATDGQWTASPPKFKFALLD